MISSAMLVPLISPDCPNTVPNPVVKAPDGLRYPKTCGTASTRIMMMTRNFCVLW